MTTLSNGTQTTHNLYNPAQAKMVAHYKSAAITYCERTGLDPLGEEHRPHPTVFGAQVTIYEWEKHVDELANLNMLMLALLATQADRLPPKEPKVPIGVQAAIDAEEEQSAEDEAAMVSDTNVREDEGNFDDDQRQSARG